MQAGHVVMDRDGHLLSLDQGFCAIMQATHGALLGRQVLDLTAPADREECGEAIRLLRETHTPFQISKRFIRDDSTLVWVINTVSMMQGADGPEQIAATIDPVITDDHRQPARLLDSARFLRDCKDDRASVCDTSLFPDTAWDALLAAYISEAEGRAVSAQSLAASLNITGERAARWINVMIGQGVIEIETRDSDAYSPKCFRLTTITHKQLENHLSRINLMLPTRPA